MDGPGIVVGQCCEPFCSATRRGRQLNDHIGIQGPGNGQDCPDHSCLSGTWTAIEDHHGAGKEFTNCVFLPDIVFDSK